MKSAEPVSVVLLSSCAANLLRLDTSSSANINTLAINTLFEVELLCY